MLKFANHPTESRSNAVYTEEGTFVGNWFPDERRFYSAYIPGYHRDVKGITDEQILEAITVLMVEIRLYRGSPHEDR